jgi:hypothetical protein
MYDLFHQHIIIEPIRLTCRLSGYSSFDSVLLKGVMMFNNNFNKIIKEGGK